MRSWLFLLFLMTSPLVAQISESIEKDKLACPQGNLGACLRVAEHFYREKKPEEAIVWYEPPCRSGDEPSCLRIAEYFKSQGKGSDALKWYRAACLTPKSKGVGCYEVGLLAKDQKSEGNAKHWFEKACSQGHKPSCKNIEDQKK